MKVACVYHPRLHDGCGKFHFVSDAFAALGHDVCHVQTNGELEAADKTCDLVLFEQRGPASLCIPDLLGLALKRRAAWIQWYLDLNVFDDKLKIADQAPVKPFLDIMGTMDIVLVKEKSRLDEYHEAGVNAIYFDQGCPSTMRQAKLVENPPFDVVLWGSSQRPLWQQRWNDVDALVRLGFKVGWGCRNCDSNPLPPGVTKLMGCQPLELPELIEMGKVVLCVDAHQGIPGYWSDRIWLAAGAGACVIRRESKGGTLLPAAHYKSERVLTEQVRHYCDDFTQRKAYGDFARRAVMARHTYEHRAKELIHHAETILNRGHARKNVPALPRTQAG